MISEVDVIQVVDLRARVRRRGLDEAVAFASTIVSTAVVILINMTHLAGFCLVWV